MGRIGQRLQTRIEQHIPWYLRQAAKVGGGKSVSSSSKTAELDARDLQPSTAKTTPVATSSGSSTASGVAASTASGATSCGRLPRRAKQASRQKGQQEDDDISSSIAKHLIENPHCAESYHPEQFTIAAFSRTQFHLKVLEAVYIQSLRPALCRQKTFVYECMLF